jgi:hypothetical protein
MSTKSIPNPEIEIAKQHGSGSQESLKAEMQFAKSRRDPLYLFYSAVIIATGAAVLIYSAYLAFSQDIGSGWMIFALLTFITAAFSLKLPKSEVRVSVPDVFVFCSILLFGPAAGALTAAMEGLMGSLRARTKSRRLHFAAFNMAAMSISAYSAGKIFEMLHPQTSEAMVEVGMLQHVVFATVVLAVYYYILNTGLLALMVSLDKRRGAIDVWMECFSWMGLGYLAAGLMAGSLSLTAQVLNPASVALLAIVPLLTYMAYRHVINVMSENNRLKGRAAI